MRPSVGIALVFMVAAFFISSGGRRRTPSEKALVPAPGTVEWSLWWNEIILAAGIQDKEPVIRRLWLRYGRTGQVSAWNVDVGVAAGGHVEMVWLTGMRGRLEIRRSTEPGPVTGLEPQVFWEHVKQLPDTAWPGPGGQIQFAPTYAGVGYRTGRYVLHRQGADGWVKQPPQRNIRTVPNEWEVRVSNAKAEPVAFWLWTP